MEKLIKNYGWHIVFWICFIIYEVTSVKVITGVFGSSKNYIMHYPINIALVYVISGYVLPKTISGKEKKIVLFSILLAISLILFLVASDIADLILGSISSEVFFGSSGIDKIFIGGTIYRYIYFMGFGITLFLYKNRISMLLQTAELEKESSRQKLTQSKLALELSNAKNAYLRAQINPHFMLSTLSYIHDSTRISEPDAAQAVIYLSKLLRYALASERGPEKITLKTEIEQVENLFKITRIRKAQTFVSFIYDQPDAEAKIIPFILLSLAENMLKHGNLNAADDPGTISITTSKGKLFIKTRNLCSSGINDTGLHTGLSSIEQRLTQNYGGLAQLTYGKDDTNNFTAQVYLPLE